MHLPLSIRLHTSRQLRVLLSFAHMFAAGATIPLVLPWTLRFLLFALVALSLLFTFYRQQPPLAVLHLGARGELEIERKVGARETATIEPHTAILPGLIVLLLRCGTERIALPLMPDSLAPDSNRQLRLWLQWRVKA